MTRGEMVDRIKYQLGLQEIVFDETTRINQEIYRGTLDMLARTRCVVRCVNLRTTADVDTYILDHGILALVDVEDGARRRARRDEVTSSPTFTLIRSDVLRLDPIPSEDGSVQVWAVLRPQQMTDDGDSLGDEAHGAIPDEYQDAIETYACWRLAAYSQDQTSTFGERFRIQYEGQDGRTGRLFQIRQQVNKRGTARAPNRRVTLPASASRGVWVG